MPLSDADRGPARAAERVPLPLGPHVAAIVAHTDAFAAAHLDAEYAALGRRMTTELARLRPSPLARGEARTWAAAILHAVGWVNFLADPSQRPHLPTAELARRTGVGQSTLAAYLRTIRAALDLVRFDPAWTRPSQLADNPLVWMVEVDGIVLDVRDASRELQEAALRAGAIPFLPEADPASERRPPALDGLWADAQAALDRALGEPSAVPAEDQDAALHDALREALTGVAAGYNARPQAELGGLSPATVQRLLDADWERADSAIRLDASLPLDQLAPARTLHDARFLLERLAERGGVKTTPKGNLPRALVAAFLSHAGTSGGGAADDRLEDIAHEHGARNEEDVWPLHHARLLLELAGLVKRRRGVVSRTRRGEQLAAPDRAGALFAALVRTHFRRLNLAYVDGVGPAPGFQYTVGYTLARFGQIGEGWQPASALADAVLLPSVRNEVPAHGPLGTASRDAVGPIFDAMALALETRVLRPLVAFGLAAEERPPRAPGVWTVPVQYRKTALFDQLFQFDVAADR